MKTHITFEIEVADVAGFLARLGLSGAPAPTIEHGVSDTASATAPRTRRGHQSEALDAAPAQETAPATEPSRRRSRGNTESPPVDAASAHAETAPMAEPSRRRRVATTADVPASPPPSISDLDLAKGASEAAEALTKLGDKGTEIVQDVLLEDFGVKLVNDIPADKRQAFLDEMVNQVRLATIEAAKVQA